MTARAIHYANYQGIPCKAVEYKRSDGLQAEPGFVIVDYADLKELKLQDDALPWRGISETRDDPGGISIHVWHKIRGTTTVADSPRPFKRAAAGLRLYGDLVLTTVMEAGGDGDSTTYSDVYATNLDEIMEDLAEAREHKFGEIRIAISDIRKFYSQHGFILGRINCHLRNGRWDPTTVKKAGRRRASGTTTEQELNGEPWSFTDVMSYLFSQLPGSPRVAYAADLRGLRPPEEIDQIGASTLSVIQGLLDDYRLVAKMLPHGNYHLARKNARLLKAGEVSRELGDKGVAAPSFISYEKKSVTYVDAPTIVTVIGGRRVRRRTEAFVPVFQDLDGHTYRLFEIDKVWDGYSIFHVNQQASKGTEKNFANVPPRPPRRKLTDADREASLRSRERVPGTRDFEAVRDLHYRRRDIMRQQAYRLYAPAALFNENCPRNKNGAIQMQDPDSDWIEFLPMGPAPFSSTALAKNLEFGLEKNLKKVGEVALHPPIVRAYRLGSVLEIDPAAAVAMLDDAIRKAEADYKNYIDSQIQVKSQELEPVSLLAEMAQQELKKSPGLVENSVAKFSFRNGGLGRGAIVGDAEKAMEEHKRAIRSHNALAIRRDGLKVQLEHLEGMKKAALAEINNWKKRRGEILLAIREEGGVHIGQSQMPYGVAPQNTYHLDPETGLLSFSELCCMIDPPILHDPNSGTVIGDGHVLVTFGHESKWNEPSDHTTVLFGRDERGAVGVIGVSATSPYKSSPVHDPELVMYEDERGIPLNLPSCIDQAARKAAHKLEGTRTEDGFVTQFSGFVKCILERGVDSVQHVWSGDDAYTFVAVNSPSWIGPAGAAASPRVIDTMSNARQSAKRAEGGVA